MVRVIPKNHEKDSSQKLVGDKTAECYRHHQENRN